MINKIKCFFLGHKYAWAREWDNKSLGYDIKFGCGRCNKTLLIVDESDLRI